MLLHLRRSNSSSSSLHFKPRDRKLRLLVAATGPRDISWASALVVRLSKNPGIEMRAIVDDVIPRLSQTIIVMHNRPMVAPLVNAAAGTGTGTGTGTDAESKSERDDIEFYRQQAFGLVEWADLMVLVPIDADNLAKMMAGIADTLLLEVLRGWDSAKKILLVPGMSTHMWENPVTKRQMSKIHRKWHWLRPMPPILWHYDDNPKTPKRIVNWSAFNDILSIIKNQADLMGLGRDDPRDPIQVYAHELEWLVLTCNSPAICKKLLQSPPALHDLPALVIKLIIRFSLIDVLAWMEANRPDLFKAFDGKVLPTKASAYYGRPDVLDYWKQSRFFHHGAARAPRTDASDLYDASALDGASKNGFVRVLDWWWRRSGLPLVFTEAALEQASGKGHLLVLEWWRDAAAQDDRIVLRPGKSLLWAAQHGQAAVLRWWVASGIPVAHGDSVAKMASRWGQVDVLELWRQLKGDDKLVFDAEVLVQPTIHQHVDVLEWWRRFAHGELDAMDGRRHRVEYRTCDIEEALEDSIGDQEKVRRWWARVGLNLGLRNIEWMRTKCL
ncbi:uncharacterized protein VDAG_05440 [Verticillium dahliae VdLs.17]|uniref:Flavoprotein domain-containing protein n=1 Tax=Verticillium dahliae (strain VdLs.17 / ATCC MYA-4575 / FGSC 10137) TaxID=498257 RepID=G2X5D5_VERDV|nr:uncharacterized protein VDAG_05440 [Verticillium dahliae VdLs.17]EGY14276.1 hypothetical protein VDAG_05440 [Verticillium dahliae VdLs.17]